jgi:hypothetical protein
MRSLHGVLDVLRIMIHAANDDQVFQAPGDEEFILVLETQVAGAQVRTITVGEVSAKNGFRFTAIVQD